MNIFILLRKQCEVDRLVTGLIYWHIDKEQSTITYPKSLVTDQALEITLLLTSCGFTIKSAPKL